jgi:hypothetical protein
LFVLGVRSAIHQALRRRNYDPIALDPWYFPTPQSYSSLLASHNFKVTHISLTPRLTPVSSIVDWQRSFVVGPVYEKAGMEREECEEVMREVEEMVRVDCFGEGEGGQWGIMYTRLRFEAVLQ